MATSFVAATNGLTADSIADTSVTTTTPSATADDYILCWINLNNGGATAPTVTPPAGWTQIGTTTDGSAPMLRSYLYGKIVAPGDPSSPVFTFSGGANAAWAMVAYRGLDTTTPVTNSSVDFYTGSTAAKNTATVTTSATGWIVSGFGDRSGGGYSGFAGTQRAYSHNSVYSFPSASWVQDSNGDVAAGNQTQNITGPAGTSVGSSFILRLNPAPAPPAGANAQLASGLGKAYDAHVVHSPLKEWMYDQGSMYVAHRGGSVDFVEMTADAYAKCHALKIKCLEMSVWKTSDNVYVLSHDQTTTRMFGVTYDIPTTPWSTLSSLTTTVGNFPMARLDEQLALYASSHIIFIDNKSDTGNAAFLNYLDTIPNSTGIFVLKGFYTNTMAALGRQRGYTSWGYYYEVDLPNLDATADKFDILSMEYSASQPAWDAVLAKGKRTLAHVCLSLNNVNTGFSKGAHGVVTGKIATAVPNAPAEAATGVGTAYGASSTSGISATAPAMEAEGFGQAFDATVLTDGVLIFRTPSVRERPYTRHPLLGRTYLSRGITLLRFGTSYQRHDDPDPELITAADAVFLGGHVYNIGDVEAAMLRAAGYGQWIGPLPGSPDDDIG